MSKNAAPDKENFNKTYPPLEGWSVQKTRHGSYHTGYFTERAKPCACGRMPVFEQYTGDRVGQARNIPAQKFVAICPVCELRARGEGSLEHVLKNWNNRKFTRDSLLVHAPMMDPDYYAIVRLSNAIVLDVVTDAVHLVKRKVAVKKALSNPLLHGIKRIQLNSELETIKGSLREYQTFIESSPLMFNHDSDAVLSAIRKNVHPELTPEKRIKIPLKLVKM